MATQYKVGDVVEWRELDEAGKPVGEPLVARYTADEMVFDRLRSKSGESVSISQENPLMETTASRTDLTALVAALDAHTRAIGNLVATLAPKVPDHVGTDYLARKLGCTPQWVAKMAENGDIPKSCTLPKVSGGRIWRFNRANIDAWLREREEG